MSLKVIAFDADDTLWHNELYFQEAEQKFCELLQEYLPQHTISRELLQVEIRNLGLYGYGVKGFILSMIETAIQISNDQLPAPAVTKIIDFGKELLEKPIVLLDGVNEVLAALKPNFKLVVATKGDLLDQERKLEKSGLSHYFHHIEIMSDKKERDYRKLVKHLDIQFAEFLMVGNSLKSDILPVLNLGGFGIHLPYHVTWAHETLDTSIEHANFRRAEKWNEIIDLIPHN